ncbi:MAG: hypothetical protein WAQ98_32075 [Blastocatellia bacterium]
MTRFLQFSLILVFLLTIACSKPLSFTFELSKEEIQKEIEGKFPLKPGSEDKEKSPVELTVSNPTVLLEEGKDQIGLKVDILAIPSGDGPKLPNLPDKPDKPAKLNKPEKAPDLPGKPPRPGKAPAVAEKLEKKPEAPPKPTFTGTATVFVSITYDPKEKVMRLSNAKITKLDFDKLPDQLNDPIKQMAEKKMSEKLAEKAIPLKNDTAMDKAVNTFLKSVTVKNGKLLVEIGW